MGTHLNEPCARCRELGIVNWASVHKSNFSKLCKDQHCTCSNHPSGVSFEYRPVRTGEPSKIEWEGKDRGFDRQGYRTINFIPKYLGSPITIEISGSTLRNSESPTKELHIRS